MSDAFTGTGTYECQFTGEQGMTAHYWIKNAGEKMRMESDMQGMDTVVIFKENAMYTWIPDQSVWMKYTMPETSPQEDLEDYEAQATDVPQYEFRCWASSFGDDKFDTPGEIMDLTQMTGGNNFYY